MCVSHGHRDVVAVPDRTEQPPSRREFHRMMDARCMRRPRLSGACVDSQEPLSYVRTLHWRLEGCAMSTRLTSPRLFKTIATALMALMLVAPGSALGQTPDVPMSEMPVMALYCERDPGPFNPGGGRGVSPDELEERYGCR